MCSVCVCVCNVNEDSFHVCLEGDVVCVRDGMSDEFHDVIARLEASRVDELLIHSRGVFAS